MGHSKNATYIVAHLILTVTLGSGYYYWQPHFTDQATKAQNEEVVKVQS